MRSRMRSFSLLVLVAGLGRVAFGQFTSSAGSMGGRPESVTDSGTLGYWTQMQGQGRAGGFLLGKVELANETPLWQPVPITVVCNGTVAYTTGTDSKNRFAITAANLPGSLSLQGDHKRQMEMFLEGCTVQAMLPGFKSSALTITHRNLREDPELGTLRLDEVPDAKDTVVPSSVSSSSEAMTHFNKAHSALMAQEPGRAQHELRKTVEADPNFAEAWYQLGRLQRVENAAEAKTSLQRAVTIDPKFVLAQEQLLDLAYQQKDWAEVMKLSPQLIALDPVGTPTTWYQDALASLRLGDLSRAETSAMRSMQIDPLHTVMGTEELLAVVEIQEKDFSEAIQHLRNCLTYLAPGPRTQAIKKQIGDLERRQSAVK